MGIVTPPSSKTIALNHAYYVPSQKYKPYHDKRIINTTTTRRRRSHLSLRTQKPKPISTTQILTQPTKPTNSNSWKKRLSSTTPTSTTTDILRLMDSLSIPIPHDIYSSLIKECTIIKDSNAALELHNHINNNSHLKPNLPLLNRLLLMHVSCGHVHPARQMFDKMPLKDFNSWAIMIVGYVNIDEYEEAIYLFVKMQQQRGNSYVFEFPAWIIVCVLKACVVTMNMGLGKQVHGLLLKLGSVNDLSLIASLINFYGKFKCLDDANFVFDQVLCRNTIIWTARIVNRCREGHFHEVINDFMDMGTQGIKKNSFTFSSVLKACAGINDGGKCGRQVHADAIKLGVESDAFVQCGLIDMYGKCGLLIDAKRVFEMIGDKGNMACWNAMLMGYVQNGFYVEAIKFLYKMKAAGMEVEESLVNEVRIACGSNTHQNRIEHNG